MINANVCYKIRAEVCKPELFAKSSEASVLK